MTVRRKKVVSKKTRKKIILLIGLSVALIVFIAAIVVCFVIKPWGNKLEDENQRQEEVTENEKVGEAPSQKDEVSESSNQENTLNFSEEHGGLGAYPLEPYGTDTVYCNGRAEGPKSMITVHFLSEDEIKFGTTRRGWPYDTVALFSHAVVSHGGDIKMGHVNGHCVPLASSALLMKTMDQPEAKRYLEFNMNIYETSDFLRWFYPDGSSETLMMDDSRKAWEW